MDDLIMNIYETESPTVETHDERFFANVCNCQRLRIRKEPSTDADILTIVDAGTKLEIVTEGETFDEVIVPGTTEHGYVMNEFLGPIYIDAV